MTRRRAITRRSPSASSAPSAASWRAFRPTCRSPRRSTPCCWRRKGGGTGRFASTAASGSSRSRRGWGGASPTSRRLGLFRRRRSGQGESMVLRSLLLAGLGLLLAGAAPFEPAHVGARIVYRHAALIDGTGAPLRADMAVVTDGERIAAVLPDRALTAAQLSGTEQVDLGGRYLLPGLIDSHQHLATPPDRPAAEA